MFPPRLRACRTLLLSQAWLARPGALIGTLLLILTLLFNPFGLRDASDQNSETWLLRMLAPLYDDGGRSEVVVVLIDDQALARLNASWPLPYREQARVLRQLIGYQPRAIFVDLLYAQRRLEGGSLDSYRRVIGSAREQGVPLILADPLDASGHSQLLPELAAVATTVPVSWSGYGERYPLLLDTAAGRQATPAMRLYQAHCAVADCLSTAARFAAAAVVRWGYWSDPLMQRFADLRGCGVTGERSTWWQIARLLLADSFRAQQDADRLARPQPCPYTRTLYLDQLRDPRVAELLRGKLVLLGAHIQGIPDLVNSPVQGQLAGVYWHAMVLDNLLVQGPHYWRDAPDLWGDFNWSDLAELLLILAAGGAAWLVQRPIPSDAVWWRRLAGHYGVWFGLLSLAAALGSLFMAVVFHIAPLDWLGLILSIGLLYAYLGEERVAHWWARKVQAWNPEKPQNKEMHDAQA